MDTLCQSTLKPFNLSEWVIEDQKWNTQTHSLSHTQTHTHIHIFNTHKSLNFAFWSMIVDTERSTCSLNCLRDQLIEN